MYVDGVGMAKDEAEAVKWYRKSAEQGFSEAQYCLGVSYEKGQGVLKDEAESAHGFRRCLRPGSCRGNHRVQQRQRERGAEAAQERAARQNFFSDDHNGFLF